MFFFCVNECRSFLSLLEKSSALISQKLRLMMKVSEYEVEVEISSIFILEGNDSLLVISLKPKIIYRG